MILVVLESEFNVINSVVDSICEKVHSSVIKKFVVNEPESEDIQSVKQSPLFGNNWIILLNRKSIKWLRQFDCTRDLIIVLFNNRKEYESNKSRLPEGFKLIDNLKVDKNVVVDWIVKELNISTPLAKAIYSRAKGRIRNIVEGVNALKSLDNITHSDIVAVIEPPYKVSIYNVFNAMLGIEESNNYKELVSYLYKFNDSGRWLKLTLLKMLDDYIQIFMDIEKGDLSLKNIDSFKALSNNKLYKELNANQLYRIIELHSSVSLEYLFLLKYTLMNTESNEVAMKLCSIVKLGGCR